MLFFDPVEHPYNGTIEKYNNNTLEPCLLRANGRDALNNILGKSFGTDDELLKYMKDNKTECALNLFDSKEELAAPDYLAEAIEFANAK